MYICIDVCVDVYAHRFVQNCIKIDEFSLQMGSKIGPKSRKSVPGGTPKWRQEAKMIKRGGYFNSAALFLTIFVENGLQDGGQNQ